MELELRQSYLKNKTIETIYFGGGTPSILSKSEIKSILDSISNIYKIKENAEIKMPDLNTSDMESAMRMIAGTARSMGIVIKG